MKFCKNLQRIVDISHPEWAPYWTNYKMLKKLIKELPSLVPTDDNVSTHNNDRHHTNKTTQIKNQQSSQQSGDKTNEVGNPSTTTTTTSKQQQQHTTDGKRVVKNMGKSPGEIAFFKLLHAEFKKVSHFFELAQQEHQIREERVREGMEILKRPNSIMVNDKWSCLAKSLYRLYKDLLLLETFAIMSYVSFSKILKKHDKVTGYQTRSAFMTNVVNNANFTNYPKVSAMIQRCQSLYDEVSRNLMKEGNTDLCEDERLFINMIQRLNMQIMDKAEKEGAPAATTQRKQSMTTSGISHNDLVASSSSSSLSSGRAECKATYALQSLVEENDAKKESSGSICLSDDPDDSNRGNGDCNNIAEAEIKSSNSTMNKKNPRDEIQHTATEAAENSSKRLKLKY